MSEGPRQSLPSLEGVNGPSALLAHLPIPTEMQASIGNPPTPVYAQFRRDASWNTDPGLLTRFPASAGEQAMEKAEIEIYDGTGLFSSEGTLEGHW